MFTARLSARSLAPAVTVAGIAWAGEKTSSRVALSTPSWAARHWQQQQQRALWTSRATSATKTTSRSLSSSTESSSFLAWYETNLQARPVVTKMCTGGLLWSIGDAVAQIVPPMAGQAPPEPYDWARTGRAAIFGFCLHAPTSHVHFNFLEYLTQKAGVQGLGIPVFKAFMEQFVYWSWISNSMYHAAMGAMQGMTGEQIYQRIKDVLWETQVAQWVFWIPVQLVNFRYTPVRHQLNVVLVTSIVWTALLSAWYPPAKKEEKQQALAAAEHS